MASYKETKDYEGVPSEEQLSSRLFLAYESAQQEWKVNADENEKFASGVQWSKEQIDVLNKRGQAVVTVNAITWAIEQLKAMLTANKPKFQATAREDSDNKKAAVWKMLLAYMWDLSDGNARLKEAIDDYAKMGRGILYAYIDPHANSGRGEVKFTTCDPRDVYPDPASKDYLYRDAAHLLMLNYKTKDQIRQHYPDFNFEGALAYDSERHNDSKRQSQEGQVFSGEKTDYNVSKYRIITRYTKKMRRVNHVIDPYADEEYHFSDNELSSYEQKMYVSWSGQIVTEDREVQQMLQMLEQGNSEPLGDNSFLYTPEPQPGPDGQMMEFDPVIVEIGQLSTLIQAGAIAIRKIQKEQVYQCISIGDKKYWSGWLPTSHYPVVPINNLWNKNPYPVSDVTMCKSLQEMINKLNSLIIANAASATNQKVLLPRGSQDKRRLELELNKAGSAIIEYDAEIGAPVVVSSQPFPNALFNQIDMYVGMIERQFGIYALMQGDTSAAPQTFKGTIAMDEFGQRRIKSKKDDIETSLNQLAKVMMDFARHTYTEEKFIRIVEPNGELNEGQLNATKYDDLGNAIGKMNDIQTGQYDVIVLSGSTLPSNRFALMEYYMDLYERGLIDQIEVLKKSEVVDVEGVLERFSYVRQLEQQMNALQEEVKKLSGDLQTAQREEVHAKKRLEVEKFKGSLEGIKQNAKASAQILQNELKGEAQMQRQQQQGPLQ